MNKFNKFFLSSILIPSMLMACESPESWIEHVIAYIKMASQKTNEIIIIQDDQIIIADVKSGAVQYIFDEES